MSRFLLTRTDAFRHTLGRVAVAVTASVILTLTISVAVFGTDPLGNVPAGVVIEASLYIAATISATITAALSYRSTIVMRQLAQAREELSRIARCDQLTGLLNRRGFDEAAKRAMEAAADAGDCIAVLMCDIDHFKSINDRFGHDFGDRVLIELAKGLSGVIESHGGIISRHGGEEFAVLLTGRTAEQ